LHPEKIKEYGSLKKTGSNFDPKYFPEIEKEADEFGEELLIPEKLLRDHFPDIFETARPLSFPKIQEIAIRFKVSILVAANRLRKFRSDVPYILLPLQSWGNFCFSIFTFLLVSIDPVRAQGLLQRTKN
jgi:Zn-dependent peptidase ImmA (M78 family)